MSFLNRLKLFLGIVLVILVLGVLTLLFNQRQNQVTSIAARVEAPRTVIASPYSGVVKEHYKNPGDSVSTGEKLFTINSNLNDMIKLGINPTSTDAYTVEINSGTVTFKATVDGYLDNFTAVKGSYVNSNERLAEIVASTNKTVVATFQLNPSDYGRIEHDAPVAIHLPDGQLVEGQVLGVNIGTDEETKKTITEVTVSSDRLQEEDLTLLTRRNTPVTAVMSLRDDGILAGPTQTLREFLVKIGLR